MKIFFVILLSVTGVVRTKLWSQTIGNCVHSSSSLQTSDKVHRDYQIFWNVPTFMCHQYGIRFDDIYQQFGIIQNNNDHFRGNNIAILYDPGMFPALLKDPNGSLQVRNGGVPQEGDLYKHLNVLRKHLDEQISPTFSGIGIIDFESWRPIFRQNWASLAPYRNYSVEIEQRKHPFMNKGVVKRLAIERFESAGQMFMEETLKLVKTLRPNAYWSYYAYPYCYNLTPESSTSECNESIQKENDKMSWLWSQEDVLLPSIYLRKSLSSRDKIGLISGRMDEAMRISGNSCQQKVLPYFWYKYQDQRDTFLTKDDLISSFIEIRNKSAGGYIIWGSSNDLNSRKKCEYFKKYLQETLGPAILITKL